MKELVDFNDRNDFDRYMSQIENSYFESVAKVSKMPYQSDSLPAYPPKPYASFQASQRSRGSSRRSSPSPEGMNSYRSFDQYLSTIGDLNRQRTKRPQPPKKKRSPQPPAEVKSKSELFNQPFFQTFIEKQNYRAMKKMTKSNEAPEGASFYKQQNPAINAINPPELNSGAVSRRFVAGPSIIERDPLA